MAGTGKTITQRIALEGGDQIKAQLDAIAKAGKESFDTIKAAASDQGILKNVAATFDAIKQKASEIGEAAREVGNRFKDLGSSLADFGKRTGAMAAAIGGVIFAFTAFVRGAANVGDEIAKTAAALGLTTTAFQELSFAAGQAGVGEEQFVAAQGRFARALDANVKQDLEAVKAKNQLRREFGLGRITIEQYSERVRDLNFQQSQQIDVFKRLGVEIAKNKDGSVNAEETELRLADAFQKSGNTALKTAAALELFGRGGLRMVGFLNQGRKGIQELRDEAQRLGLVVGGDVLKRQEQLNDSFDKLSKATRSTRLNVAAVFTPTLTRVIDAIVEAMARWRASAIVLATQLANKLVPIVEDFIALLEGREGDIQNGFILQARDAVVAFGVAVKTAVIDIIIPAFKLLLGALEVVAQAINGIFGTKFSGQALLIAAVILKLTGAFGVLKAAVAVIVSIIGLLVTTFGALPVVIGAIVVALALFIANNTKALQTVKDAWNAAFTFISDVVTRVFNGFAIIAQTIGTALSAVGSGIATGIGAALSTVGTLVSTAFAALALAAQTVVQNIIAFFTLLPQALGAIFGGLAATLASAWSGIVAGAQAAWQAIVDGFNAALTALATVAAALLEPLNAIWTAIVTAAQAAWTAISNGAIAIGTAIVTAFRTAVDAVSGFFTSMRDYVLGIFKTIIDAAAKVVSAISSAFSGGAGKADGGGVGFAGGGSVRGPGSSRSDSIPAWLSNGEFVIKAAAVRKYGAALFAALNGMRVPAKSLQFSGGGMVDALSLLMPRPFADGGMVGAVAGGGSGGRPFTLQLGDQSFGGMTASDDAVDQLQRFALNRAVRSAGRKPAWFRG